MTLSLSEKILSFFANCSPNVSLYIHWLSLSLRCVVPTHSPNLYYVHNISSSALNVKWELLEDQWSEGPLDGYTIYFRPTDEHELCNFYQNCTSPNSTFVNASISEVDLLHLKLNYNYTVWMVAQTTIGSGPESSQIIAMTDYFSMYNLSFVF